MRNLTLLITAIAVLPSLANAANDVYGTVSELITRSGENGDNLVYFRLNVMSDYSSFESCVSDGDNLVWEMDLTSPVADYQYDIIKTSYAEQLPVRVIGDEAVCSDNEAYSDRIFELSPWAWPEH